MSAYYFDSCYYYIFSFLISGYDGNISIVSFLLLIGDKARAKFLILYSIILPLLFLKLFLGLSKSMLSYPIENDYALRFYLAEDDSFALNYWSILLSKLGILGEDILALIKL